MKFEVGDKIRFKYNVGYCSMLDGIIKKIEGTYMYIYTKTGSFWARADQIDPIDQLTCEESIVNPEPVDNCKPTCSCKDVLNAIKGPEWHDKTCAIYQAPSNLYGIQQPIECDYRTEGDKNE